jgi:hypothetical protein
MIEAKAMLVAAENAPRVIARLKQERPFAEATSTWPGKAQSRPQIEFSVGVPSGRWALLAAEQHESASPGHDWAPTQVVGLMSSGNRRTLVLGLFDQGGRPVGLTTVTLRLYFWQQSRILHMGTLARSYYADIEVTNQGGRVDCRLKGSGWLRRLTFAEIVSEALEADSKELYQAWQRPAGTAWTGGRLTSLP